jgi:deferrochelatase/peroxidase EfeB
MNRWLQKNGPKAPFCQGSDKPAEKLAAYLMGRWRNGTPVHENPHSDEDESLHASNDFDYEPRDKHDKCPFAAHTRKMRPRSDLGHDHAVIIRRGIPYGPEVSDGEKAAKTSDTAAERERGLLFACYQSDIRNGFNFLTTRKCASILLIRASAIR